MKHILHTLKRQGLLLAIMTVLIGLVPEIGWGQTTVTYAGMGSVTCPAAPTATISPSVSGLTFSQLSRGSGVTCSSAGTGISGSGFNVTLANAISGSKWYLFSITSDATVSFTVSSLSIVSQVSAATGSPSVDVQYSIGAGAKTSIGSFTPTTSSVAYTITPGAAISVAASQTINIFVVPNNLTATGTTCRVNNNTSVTVTTTSTGSTAPTIISPTATNITDVTATLGGNITSDGGSAITERGTVWKTSTGVTISDNKLAEGGTTTGVFTHTRSSLPSGSQIFYKAYATNTIGTALTTEGNFYTLSTEPAAHAAAFSATAMSSSQIDLSFSAASTISNAAGYLIIQRSGSAPTGAPTDANGYTVGNTIGDGTVASIVTSNSATTASITSLTAGTTYYFTIFPYNWNATNTQTYNYKTDGTPPGSNATTFTPASVTTTAAISSITINSAVSGGSGLSENGNAITAKGVCWNTAANPTIANSTTNNGTGTTAFTSNLSSLTAQTLYYVRAYATNSGGTGYGNELTFYTLSNEPTGQASNLTATTVGTTTQNLSWTAATFPATGASNKGYILIRAVAPNIPSLSNSDGEAPAGDANTTIVSSVVSNLATTYPVNSLISCTNYIYKIIPFCWDGTHATTYNYLFTSAPESAPKITACESSDAISAGGESTTISSLMNDNAPLTSTTGTQVWQFTIRDGGAGMNDADALPTIVSAINLTKNNDDKIADWDAAIKTIALFDGATPVDIATITTASPYEIQFSFPPITILDNTSKTFSVRLSLKGPLGAGNADKQYFVFSLTNVNITTPSNGTSSRISGFNAIQSLDAKNVIDVLATKIAFVQQPTSTIVNVIMAPPVTVSTTDIHGNRDLDYTSNVSITSTGTLTGAPVIQPAVSGLATFSTLTHTVVETGRTLTAGSGSLTGTISNTFDITDFIFLANDFRPKYTTNLSFNGDWEYFNGSVWGNVTDGKAPQNTTTTIGRVLITDYVSGGGTDSKAYNCDFIVMSGGELYIDAKDLPPIAAEMIAAGKKLEVLSGGKLTVEGDIDIAATGNLIVRNGGQMVLNQASIDNSHPMWDGNELFESGSTVTINDWKWSASATNRSLIAASTKIKSNLNGYKFGNLIIDINSTDSWTLIGGNIGIINLCENDLDINNISSFFIGGASNKTGTNGFIVNGNMTIYDGPFSFGSSYSNDAFDHLFTINGNFECASNDALKIHLIGTGTPTSLNGNVTFNGDVKIASTVSSFTNDGGSGVPARMSVNFSGGTLANPKIIDIAPIATAINMNVKASSVRKLSIQDLTLNSVSSYTTTFNVESGGTLHFGWANNGTTPLVIKQTTTSPSGNNYFTLQSAGSLIITSADGIDATSTTIGNVRTPGTRTFSNSANYTYTGTAAQVTGSGLPATVNNLTIDNSGGVSLTNPAVTVSSTLLINAEKKFFIGPLKEVTATNALTNNGGEDGLTIQSDATGTGSLLHNTSDVPATIERYVTGDPNLTLFKYHFVSVPLKPNTNNLSGIFLYSYLFDFDETTNNWHGLGTPVNTILDETRGYMTYAPSPPTYYYFKGLMNNGTFNPLVTYTSNGPTTNDDGWNLIPNPYPSALDFDVATRNNVDAAIYIWPSEAGASATQSNYYSYAKPISIPEFKMNGKISIGQSFFVHATGSPPSIIFENNDRVHSSQPFYKNTNEIIPNILRLKSSVSGLSDEIVVRIHNDATENFDTEFDAYKLTGGADAPQLASFTQDGKKLSINSLPFSATEKIIPLYFSLNKASEITFSATGQETFSMTPPIYLEDLLLNKVIDLQQQAEYTFAYQPGQTNRFQLRFMDITSTGKDIKNDGAVFYSNGKINIDVPGMEGKQAVINTYDVAGRCIKTTNTTINGIVQVDAPLATGVYIVRVVSGNKTFAGKIVIR